MSACRRPSQGTAGDQAPVELNTLLASVLQDAGERESSLMERVQQQQIDLQALISAAQQDTCHQQEQHACLEQMQVFLHHRFAAIQVRSLGLQRTRGLQPDTDCLHRGQSHRVMQLQCSA